MTTFVSTGLLPAAISTGIGSQTLKPLALVVIGGCLILALVARVLQPPILLLAHEWLERWVASRQKEISPSLGPPATES
jgi:cobalt-zinc-cadmium resistance protein CzcA